MATEIRPYRDSDWSRVCEIHDRARYDELRGSVDPAGWLPLAEVAEAEGLFKSTIWVYQAEDRVVGFIAAMPTEITWLYVDPDHHRQGIGRKLLRHVLAQRPGKVTLAALGGNTSAIALYESEGFRITSSGPSDLNGDGKYPCVAIVMERVPAATPDRG
jgi:ribosomal protein S18 acetylase RimI-like enzyme